MAEYPDRDNLTRYLSVLSDPGDMPDPPSGVAGAEHWEAQYVAAWWYLKTFTSPSTLRYSRPLDFDWTKHRIEKLAGFYVSDKAVEVAAAALGYADPLFEFAWRCSALTERGRRCRRPSVAHRHIGCGEETWLPRCDLHQHPNKPGPTDPALWSQLGTVREHLERYRPSDLRSQGNQLTRLLATTL